MSRLAASRIRVAVDGADADGLLVLNDGALVAVLVCLDQAFYGKDEGRWHLEAGFGRCAASPPTFETVNAALRWIGARLGLAGDGAAPATTRFRDGS